MRRFIITGAPGAGKTAIIRQLELDGFSVVEEAATDVIAAAHAQGTLELWRHPSFIDAIAHLQRDRVLGQREMESRRSPLASKLRFSAAQFGRRRTTPPNAVAASGQGRLPKLQLVSKRNQLARPPIQTPFCLAFGCGPVGRCLFLELSGGRS